MVRTPAPKGPPKAPVPTQPNRWDRKLSRVIEIVNGPAGKLTSLDDARHYILANFEKATKNVPLIHAIELLIRAAVSGKLSDREAATAQVERVLRARYWL